MRTSALSLAAIGWLGCSGEAAQLDAGNADAAAEVDALTGTVEVQVLGWEFQRGEPIAGAAVLFHDASGALIAHHTTGPDGLVSTEVEAGAWVTVIHSADRRLTTIAATQPGDQLVVGRRVAFGAITGNATVALPAGGTLYRVSGPCAEGTSTSEVVPIELGDGCPAAGPLLALRGPLDAIDGYIYDPAATITPGATLTLPGPWQAPGAVAVAVDGADLDYVHAGFGVVAGERLVGFVWAALPGTTGGVLDGALAAPTGLGDATLTLVGGNSLSGGYQLITELRDGHRTTIALDGSELLPEPTITATATTGAEWSLPRADHDVTTARFAGGVEAWEVFLPPEVTSVSLPVLPDELALYWDPAGVRVVEVTVFESSHLAGYDDARAAPLSLPEQPPTELAAPFRLRSTMKARSVVQ